MNRNVESHFALADTNLTMKRSVFDRSHSLKTTFNAGKLIPFYLEQDVLPGDTFNMDFGVTCRMTPSVHPTMDNCYLDTYFFFVPYRLVWTHWKEFCGENTSQPWVQTTEYTIPQLSVSTGASSGFQQGSVADYLGLPTNVKGVSVSALPARAYALIFNEWFRDQNLQSPCSINFSDTTSTYQQISTIYTNSASRGGALCPVNKYHDYFTSCLPNISKAPAPVVLPVINSLAPIHSEIFKDSDLGIRQPSFVSTVDYSDGQYSAKNYNLGNFSGDNMGAFEDYSSPPLLVGMNYNISDATITSGASNYPYNYGSLYRDSNGNWMNTLDNFYADLSQMGVTIASLRTSFQILKFYEKQALYGTRYNELCKAFFGVAPPDARIQRPEYLGGDRIPISISQVVQTSSTDATSPQANVAAYSLTNSRSMGYRKAFNEHGMILGVCCVRTDHTYQQGIPRGFLRKTKFDFYWTTFAHISNQPVYNAEIYCQGSGVVDGDGNPVDNGIFGYQECFADYRFKPNRVTGQFRSNATGTLDSWHYADNYSALPTLTSTWVAETDVNVNRTLAVSSSVADQFIADFYFKDIAYRVMPVFGTPGLVDHF